MEREDFYRMVGEVLGVRLAPTPHLPYRRRWGQRAPGNGRYEGHGIVRWYSEGCIQVSLIDPPLMGQFTASEALDAIVSALHPGALAAAP